MSTQSNNNKRIAKNMRNHLLRLLLHQVTRLLQKRKKSIGQAFYSHRLSEEQAVSVRILGHYEFGTLKNS